MKHRAKNGGNDAYYTNPVLAGRCVDALKKYVGKNADIIEPSAGNGAFMKPLIETWGEKVRGYDLYPTCETVIQSDWFDVTVPKKSVVVGNPPFGFAASLAIRFFNHAATNASIIAFIVPRSFQKVSVHRRLNRRFHLVHEEVCPHNSFLVDGVPYDVPCVFQIWKRKRVMRINPVETSNPYFKFVNSPTTTSFCIRRVGGRAGEVLAGNDHSSNTTYHVEPLSKDAKKAVIAVYPSLAILRDNTAGVRSISKHELNAVLVAYAKGNSHVKT